jgi:hypothetical protein
MFEQSKELTAFYRAYAQWLDRNAPNLQPFRRNEGLCRALLTYGTELYPERVFHADDEMDRQFEDAGLDVSYPFGKDEYALHRSAATMHLDPKRTAWVREHAK